MLLVGLFGIAAALIAIAASVVTLAALKQVAGDEYRRTPSDRRNRWIGAILGQCFGLAVLSALAIAQVFGPHTWIWILGVAAGLCVIAAPIGAAAQARQDFARARQHRGVSTPPRSDQ